MYRLRNDRPLLKAEVSVPDASDSLACGPPTRSEIEEELPLGHKRLAEAPSERLLRQVLMRRVTRQVWLLLDSNRDTLMIARGMDRSILGRRDPLYIEGLRVQGEWKALDFGASFDSIPPHGGALATCVLAVRRVKLNRAALYQPDEPYDVMDATPRKPESVGSDSIRWAGWMIHPPVWIGGVVEIHVNPALIDSRLYIPSERRYARDCREGIAYAVLASLLPAENWVRKTWGVPPLPASLIRDQWAFATFLARRDSTAMNGAN